MRVNLAGETVLVVGFGDSGIAATKLLAAAGARVLVYDRNRELSHKIRSLGGEPHLGEPEVIASLKFERVVLSPGVPPLEEIARVRGEVAVWSEVELAYNFIEDSCKLIGVTGTNGKSTTTTMIGEMCRLHNPRTFVGGNLGTPFCEAVLAGLHREALLVIELSSFHLEDIESLRCDVAVLTNVTDDHLNRHADFAEYEAAKGRIFENQRANDFAVVASDDEITMALARKGGGLLKTFVSGDATIGESVLSWPGADMPMAELALQEDYHVRNAAAAALVASLVGIDAQHIAQTLRRFQRLPHRNEFVGEFGGVRYFNDAKGTNVGAAAATLAAMDPERKVVLIAGGVHKGGSYAPLCKVIAQRCRYVVLVGVSSPLIASAIDEYTAVSHETVATFDQAVAAAMHRAEPGDIVLLAPACSTYDQYPSFELQGERFVELVTHR